MPPKREPDTTDKLTMFGLRQEMALRKSLVELLHRPGIQPCDDAAPCADQHPAQSPPATFWRTPETAPQGRG